MLSATQGVHPGVLDDNGEHASITQALHNGSLDKVKPTILRYKRRLLDGAFKQDEVDGIMSGCRVTDAEAYAFAQLHAAVAEGMVLTASLALNRPPSLSSSVDIDVLRGKRFSRGKISLDITMSSSRDPWLRVYGTMPFVKRLTCSNPEICQGSHPSEETAAELQTDPHALLDIGPTSASRALAKLKVGCRMARWAEGSRYLHILAPSIEFEARSFLHPFASGDDRDNVGVSIIGALPAR